MTGRKKTYVIAEAGVNHNGSMVLAKRLVVEAKKAGADAVKFQSFKTGKLVVRATKKAAYQLKTTPRDESQYDMLKKLELSDADHRDILRHCRKVGITFLSSPFDEESADLLEGLGVSLIKIPSGEITNHPLLRHIARKKIPIILSTGMSTLGEVEEALDAICSAAPVKITLLHCVTEYPAPYRQINLAAMETLKRAFHLPVGYSDHTPGIEISIAAVALGAEVIEKHFTLDKGLPGPDHKASLDPREFREMTGAIAHVEAALGRGIKKPADCEKKNIPIARKSLVAIEEIKAGEKLSRDKISVKRPGHGISPVDLEKVIGLKATQAIAADEVITWSKLR